MAVSNSWEINWVRGRSLDKALELLNQVNGSRVYWGSGAGAHGADERGDGEEDAGGGLGEHGDGDWREGGFPCLI